MPKQKYSTNVFINCPFDKEFLELRNALLFVIYDCGFTPRCALEEDDSGNVRFAKIVRLINESMFGIHDISRIEIDPTTQLPRFNMPFELGLFLGAKNFGYENQQKKNCLILDSEPYRYQKYLSDISGQDIRSHNASVETLIKCARDWLNSASKRKTIIPGGTEIARRFKAFQEDLPAICKKLKNEISELTYNDFSRILSEWLKENDNNKNILDTTAPSSN